MQIYCSQCKEHVTFLVEVFKGKILKICPHCGHICNR